MSKLGDKIKEMSLSKQFLIAALLKYATLIIVPLIIAFIYFKVYTVEEGLSYCLIAAMAVGAVCAVKFGRKAIDNEFPDRFRWIGTLIWRLILTGLIIGLLVAIKSYIVTAIYMAIFVAVGEVTSIPFVVWENIAKYKDYESSFGTRTLAEAMKNYSGGGMS